MKTLLLILSALYLTACAGSGSGGASVQTKVDDIPADLVVPPVDPSAPVLATPSLTYYKLSKTIAPVNGWTNKTVTLTASCIVYTGKTYCWDDGVKTIASWVYNNHTYGPYTYTYFGLAQRTNGGTTICFGGCSSDFMPAPRVISTTLQTNIGSAATGSNPGGGNISGASVINEVFTSGAALNVNCSEQDGQLNCVDFIVNLNQAPL